MYKKKFAEWGNRKNITRADAWALEQKRKERMEEGKDTECFLGNKRLKPARIQRHLKAVSNEPENGQSGNHLKGMPNKLHELIVILEFSRNEPPNSLISVHTPEGGDAGTVDLATEPSSNPQQLVISSAIQAPLMDNIDRISGHLDSNVRLLESAPPYRG